MDASLAETRLEAIGRESFVARTELVLGNAVRIVASLLLIF